MTIALPQGSNVSAEQEAKMAWCNQAASKITASIKAFLSPPVSVANKDEVLKQVQAAIAAERREMKKAK